MSRRFHRLDRPYSALAILCALAACAVLLGCNGAPVPQPEPEPEPPKPDPQPLQCNAVLNQTDPTAMGIDERALGPNQEIVGGFDAPIDKFPFAAAIVAPQPDGTLFQFCGGSLIAPDWVLTAAHCRVTGSDKVVLGRQDLTTDEGMVHDIEFAFNHADYDPDTQENDIALVKLATPSAQGTVGLVDAADSGSQAGDDATIIGWGRLVEGGPTSNLVQEVTIPIVGNDICQAGYAADGIDIAATMLCAGLPAGEKDSCQGDSGGPLMVPGAAAGAWSQAGVVSFGIGCARPGKYGVYTRVSQYRTWLEACQANPPS